MRIKIILFIVAVVFAMATFFATKLYLASNKDVNRLTDVISQNAKVMQNLSLKTGELEYYLTKRDSQILADKKIKQKDVKEFVTNNYYYSYKDTIFVSMKPINDTLYNKVIMTDCASVDIDVSIKDNKPNLRLNSLRLNDTIRNILSVKRKHWYSIFKKELILTTTTQCGETTTKRIEITK